MTGLLFILLAFAWCCIAFVVAVLVTRRLNNVFAKFFVGLAALVLGVPLPVADEIVAEYQFNALCRRDANLYIDAARIGGRRVKVVFDPSNAPVPDTAVPIVFTHVSLRDESTGEELARYRRYVASGGWLARSLGLSNSSSPLWMTRSYCQPEVGPEQMALKYNFEIVKKGGN